MILPDFTCWDWEATIIEITKQLQIDLASKSSLARFVQRVSSMDDCRRSKFPLGRNLDSRQWGSETDIRQSSLPPIQSNEKKNSNFKWITNISGKQLNGNRPPTPRPASPAGRNSESLFSFGKTSRISPSSSHQRLSLNLDLRSIVKGGDFRRHSSGFTDHSPEGECSPRMYVRSLPPSPTWSPTTQRRRGMHHRHLRRLSSDSEQGDARDDRIVNWLRDISEKTQGHTNSFEDEGEDNLFENSLEEYNDIGFNAVNGLPVIQEGRKT